MACSSYSRLVQWRSTPSHQHGHKEASEASEDFLCVHSDLLAWNALQRVRWGEGTFARDFGQGVAPCILPVNLNTVGLESRSSTCASYQ